MLLQVVSVIVAPFGIARMASPVANCSDAPWAVARFPPASAVVLHRIVAINRAACRMTRSCRDVFGLHRARLYDSCGGVQQPPRHQRWFCGFASVLAPVSGFSPGSGGGGRSVAGWIGRRRVPHLASNGTITRRIGSALRTGNDSAHDATRTVIRSLIRLSLPILDRDAVAPAAPSELRP